MKRTPYYIYIALLVAITSACSNDDGTYSVGEDENAIKLYAGIVSSANISDMTSRASGQDIAMLEKTKMSLQINGDWTDHGTAGVVSQPTSGETTTFVENNQIRRKVECNPVLYWDDYGTADPQNTAGRTKGLTIYAAAVNKAETTAPTVGDFAALSWTLDANQSEGWDAKDLLISNNVSGLGTTTETDANAARYNFSERSAGKLLKFQHSMSKVTINLTAGEGFPDSQFQEEPTVTIQGFPTSGTVNVTNGEVQASATTTDITTHRSEPSAWAKANKVTRDAIVFPTRSLTATDVIAKVEADGNIYYVTAASLVAAMPTDDKVMKSGINYILNITVNKTEIEVTAALVDWSDVIAESIEPVINVSTSVGTDVTQKEEGFSVFDFYLSTADNAEGYGSTKKATASGSKTDGSTAWTFDPKLYWPNHNTHYFMRGVYPSETAVTDGKISVENGIYNAETYPSNLLVGAPVISENTMCESTDHTQVDMSKDGICAREATVNLTFNYMMSQVEVRLTTTTGSDHVELADAVVEIVNGYTKGDVNIHSEAIDNLNNISDFTIPKVAGEGKENYRHSIVVPQALTNGTGESAQDLQFRITIKNSDSSNDVYYATIKNIKVKEGDAAAGTITEWQSGKHYIYTLEMRKTEVKVSATITDWKTVEGEDDIWF